MHHRTASLRSLFVALVAATLAACNGGAQSSMPAMPAPAQPATQDVPPAVQPAAPAAPMSSDSLSPVVISPGSTNGEADMFRPRVGDTSTGGQGQVVDHLACTPGMVTNKYHVHVYFGIVYNGKLIALPRGLGMKNPGPAVNGYVNSATCFYSIHTHDSSGMVHLEVDRSYPLSKAVFRMKPLLDVWGQNHDATHFGPFSGPIHIFTGNVPLKQTVVSSYQPYAGALEDIPLHSHEVVWLEIGNTYYTASQLPSVTFYTEY